MNVLSMSVLFILIDIGNVNARNIVNFRAAFENSGDGDATKERLNDGTVVGSWVVEDAQEGFADYLSGSRLVAFDQGLYTNSQGWYLTPLLMTPMVEWRDKIADGFSTNIPSTQVFNFVDFRKINLGHYD